MEQEKEQGKSLPVWFFLLCLLLGALFTMSFAWVAKGAITNHRFGKVGEAAAVVASFPDLVRDSFKQVEQDTDSKFRVPRTSADLSQFEPIKAKHGIDVRGLVMRADRAAVERAAGWRILLGGFTFNGELNQGAVVLSPDLQIVKTWTFPEEDMVDGVKSNPPAGKLVHGFALLKDGSVVVAYDVGVSLQRFDRCGRRMWATGGYFDHAVTPDEDGEHLWTLRREQKGEDWLDEVVQVEAATGKVARTITMDDIIAANPDVHILDIREQDDNWGNGNPRTLKSTRLDDPFHLNDVEPLPAAYADRFPNFKAGDLLLSVRSLNLILVFDPASLHVKWWSNGGWRRQHDPDWEPNGEISVFDNRMNMGFSQIDAVDPTSGHTKVLFDGRSNDFYSRIRGTHQFTAAGNLLVASPQQGRAFEVDASGQPVLEIYNTRPGAGEFNYPMSEAHWLPAGALDFDKDLSCAK